MRKTQSALGHHLDQIPKAEFVPQVPAHAQDDHLTVEVPPCKQLFNAAQLAHQTILSFPKMSLYLTARPRLHQSPFTDDWMLHDDPYVEASAHRVAIPVMV